MLKGLRVGPFKLNALVSPVTVPAPNYCRIGADLRILPNTRYASPPDDFIAGHGARQSNRYCEEKLNVDFP